MTERDSEDEKSLGQKIAHKVGTGVVALALGFGANYAYHHWIEGESSVPRPPVDGECTDSKLDSLRKIDDNTYEAVGMLAGRSCTYVFDSVTGVDRTSIEVGDTFDMCALDGRPDRAGASFITRRNNGYLELTENAQLQMAELKPRGCNLLDL